MRVRTHLIAMPWAPPDSPSIQIGCLKAHLDRALQGRSDCHAYSAFFSILHDFSGRHFQNSFLHIGPYREYVYQALYLRRFGPAEFGGRAATMGLLKALRKPSAKPISLPIANGLERATCRFLDREVGPRLIAAGLNLVGFTLNYNQVYSSLYAAEYLRRRFPQRRFLFVYGGCSASLPNVYDVLRDLGVPGVIVVGEGEKRLELLVRTLTKLPPAGAPAALAAVAGLDPGIIVIGEQVDLGARNPAYHASQMPALKELPLPDYDEYFAALRRACADERTYAAFCAATDILVEGSRGCFGKCDFCGLNRTWRGFRMRPAGQILRDTLALSRKYGTSRIQFADSVCDSWAEEWARMLVRDGIHQAPPLELRANHPEPFWTLLALAGVESVQVGVEALSSPLLKAMGKGTRAVQNLAAHKYLAELGIDINNNLIAYHPASTLSDIRETRRIVSQIPHWPPFDTVEFVLMAGSPLYERLSREERAALRPMRSFRLPRRAARYAIECWFETPDTLQLADEVRRGWNAFLRAYERMRARFQSQRPRLDVIRVAPDTVRITDTRDGRRHSYDFSGAAARIYDACHRGLKLEEIVEATGLSPQTAKAKLARFMRLKLVLRVDDDYLSLAMRPRDELLRRFFAYSRNIHAA
jgi:radical SAM superfamily enzyme YgiQ (UPF0313 family)